MNKIGVGWMPSILVFKASNTSVGSTATMTVSIDKTIQFKAFAMTGFAFQNGTPATAGYFTIDSMKLGAYARKIIYGSSLHSKYFSQFTAMPVRFEGEVWENTDIEIIITNVSSGIAIDTYVIINGLQKQVGA